jgi:hypothetical protein
MSRPRLVWSEILAQAAAIVESYDTGVTLRQCFYRLVAAELLPNTVSAYTTLSARTAEARRARAFPSLIDLTREITRFRSFDAPDAALQWLARIYRHDRTRGQDYSVYAAVEKRGIVQQLVSWFGELGIPIIALGGYASQTFADEIAADVEEQHRPAALIYAGDFDPSGEDIERDFIERTGCFDEVVHVALNAEQVEAFELPPLPGKATDTRAASFEARHGRLVQVELDALPPDVLRDLYSEAISQFFDMSTFEAELERERRCRARLTALARIADGQDDNEEPQWTAR